MKRMTLKNLTLVLVLTMTVATMTGCQGKAGSKDTSENIAESSSEISSIDSDEESAAYQYKTYEFETFSGETVTIDESNIISQITVENAAETDIVPADAEVIAPGRDFIYLADETNYYVEDLTNNMLTIAQKSASGTMEVSAESGANNEASYINNFYKFNYDPNAFNLFKDEVAGSVTLSFCADNVKVAGSNVITFSYVEGMDAASLMRNKVKDVDGDPDRIGEVSLSCTNEPVPYYATHGESGESELSTSQAWYAVPCGGNASIFIELFRTVGPDDASEMSIDGAFEYIMGTFQVVPN